MEKSSIQKLAMNTFTSQFHSFENPKAFEQSTIAIKKNRVEVLHTLNTASSLSEKDSLDKNLLFYAIFENSPVCILYLMHKHLDAQQIDKEGKTITHISAYMGHIESFKMLRYYQKIQQISQLNNRFIDLLTKNNFKRTDAKAGDLKFSVSEGKRKTFEAMQENITNEYAGYTFDYLEGTFQRFSQIDKNSNRNSFHYVCFNKYQRCLRMLEFLLEQLNDYQFYIDQDLMQKCFEVNNHFDEGAKFDPRLTQDALSIIKEFIRPNKLAEIKKQYSKKVSHMIYELLQAKDKNGHSPLFIASQNGNTGMINILKRYQHGNKDSAEKEDIIKIACNNMARSHIMDLCDASKECDSKTMNFLISCGDSINKKKTIFGTFPLLEAVKSFEKSHNLQPIQLLIRSGADLNEQDTNGWTVMHHICEKGSKPLIEEIFKIYESGKTSRINLNRLTNKNYHILHLAAMNNHPEIIDYLLNNQTAKKLGIKGNSTDGDGCTILHQAARKGSLEALKKILENDEQIIYCVDVRSNTALHYAAMGDHADCIRQLLYFDSDFDELQTMRNTKGKVAKELTINKRSFQNAFTAARGGDVNLVRKMLTQDPKLKDSATVKKERSLLALAVFERHLLVVKYLVESGVNRDSPDKYGKIPLQYALEMAKNAKNKREAILIKNIIAILE